MKLVNAVDFISVLSEPLPPMILYYSEEQKKEADKIKKLIEKLEKKLPLLKVFEFITDANDSNQRLSEEMEVNNTPILIFYKNGCFNRYKDKIFTEKSIEKFVGNKSIYQQAVVSKPTM